MKEKAKQIFNELKAKSAELSAAFDDYVEKLVAELEIDKTIAVTLVTDELVNQNQKSLILHGLFSKATLENMEGEKIC